jgi:hypothetical protein
MGLNYGLFNEDDDFDVVISGGSANTFPRKTYALDGRSGEILWVSKIGTYWDATIAVWDINRDSIDDVILNSNASKGIILDGHTGQQIAEPTVLPKYGEMEVMDYNGAPVVVGAQRDGRVKILNAEDDAHLSLLSINEGAESSFPYQMDILWAAPQSSPDDERFSMPAVAPTLNGEWIVGVGNQHGTLKVRRGNDGSLLWEKALWAGCSIHPPGQWNPLSSVIALDVNNDGRVEFVVGGADGWLYAVDTETGNMVWSFDLGSPVGGPIAGDLNNNGFSELLVPAADGYLYAITSAP